ncbi:MAG: hypothetical protein WEG36_01970 [Gemmatimonadota bacterium]
MPQKIAILSSSFVALASFAGAAPASAQGAGAGAFETQYPEVHALVLATQEVQGRLLEFLATELVEHATIRPETVGPGGQHADHQEVGGEMMLEAGREELEAYGDLLRELRRLAASGVPTPRTGPPGESGVTPRLRETVVRTQTLLRQMLDIYADTRIFDKYAAVDRVVAEYRSDPERALPVLPKSMALMYLHTYAGAFGANFSFLQGMTWASSWLQFAAFEPLFLYERAEEQRFGMEIVVDRFWRKLEAPPMGFPTEMPMVPAISPGLRGRHPQAAAIFDNLDILLAITTDVVLHPGVGDKEGTVEAVLDAFTNPEYEIVSLYDWTLMALRHGIYNQGGPAIGLLDRSERNVMLEHAQHGGGMVLPGMPR